MADEAWRVGVLSGEVWLVKARRTWNFGNLRLVLSLLMI